MHKQFLAGYLTESVRKKLNLIDDELKLMVKGLLQSLCSFDVTTTVELGSTPGKYNPFLAVIHNMITRGIPTIAPVQIEEAISKAFAKTNLEVDDLIGEFSFPFSEDPSADEMIYDALHLMDPRLDFNGNNYNSNLLESSFEKDFLFKYLDGENQFLRQLLLPQ